MKAIILAAGRGSRLKGITDDRPKCLSIVRGMTMLESQLSVLKTGGVDEIIIVTGYKNQVLEMFGCRTVHNLQWEETNMVVSLLCASEEFAHGAIVSYSDIIYGKDIVSQLAKRTEDIVIVYDRDWKRLWELRFEDPLQDAESFVIDSDGRIRDIGRKVQSLEDVQGQYTGLMRFSKKAFEWIEDFCDRQPEKVLHKMDMTTMLRSLIKERYPVYGMAIDGGWCEIDTETDLALANRLCAEGRLDFCG
ncbi:MAG: phosphocholine cytidylyltransferase family protein [Planctomycetes bacterium]|nr:phosphocholine cytidylyltransferase family protein [Planctomycetota bacterium]